MVRLVAFWLSLLIGTSGVLADAKQDCEKLRGDAAIAACTAVIARNPQDARAYFLRGLEYYNKKDLDRSIADYTKVIAIDPNYADTDRNRPGDAYHNRAWAYHLKGDRDRAIADFRRALAVNPARPDSKAVLQKLFGVGP